MSEIKWTIQPGDSPSPPLEWKHYNEWGYDEDGRIGHLRFGRWFYPEGEGNELDLHLKAFLEGWTKKSGALGKEEHGRRAVDLIWNSGEKKNIIWTPEMTRMFSAACVNRYLGIAGAASCNKSHFAALWALINFYAAPEETMVLMTSTSITAARQRCWASVVKLYNAMPKELRNVAKMIGSNGILRYREVDEDMAATDTRGITLVAAEPRQDSNAIGKLIGRKQRRLIMCADELPELGHSINTAARGNLVNNPDFQFIALGNPAGYQDPFGIFCKPLAGWASINETMDEWPIRGGICLHFDALKSTNYIERRVVYDFMPTYEVIEEAREEFGEQSLMFFRMYRGYFPPQGTTDTLYSSYDLATKVVQKEPEWGKEGFHKVAGLDVSFTSDGDKTVLTILHIGRNKEGKWCVDMPKKKGLQESAQFTIKESVLASETSRSSSITSQVKKLLEEYEVPFENFGYDCTGGGATFGDYLTLVLGSKRIVPVQFGGAASDRPGSGVDRRPACERYANRSSEIWAQGTEFLRGGQWSRLPDKLCEGMSLRQYTTGMRGSIKVLPKKEMKLLTGRSPDEQDSFFIALDVAIQRFNITSQERKDRIRPKADFYKEMQRLDIVTQSQGGRPDWEPMIA